MSAQPKPPLYKYPTGRGEWNKWLAGYAAIAANGSRFGVSRVRELYTSIPSPTHPAANGGDKQRAAYWGVEYEDICRRTVYERDGWRCGICRQPISQDAKYPAPGFATLDHIEPMSLGGPHLYVNVQAAHLRCNVKKSRTGCGDQLALMG
jgi:hypothetical protein